MKVSDITGDEMYSSVFDDTREASEAHEDALARYRQARDAEPFFKRNTLIFAALGIVFLCYFIGSILHAIWK